MADMFEVEFDAAVDAAMGKVADLVRTAALELTAQVLNVAATPVDSGCLMGNMRPSLDTIDTTVNEGELVPDGDAKLSECKQVLDNMVLGQTYYLANSLPYAAVIEYGLFMDEPFNFPSTTPRTTHGFSTQAPEGMFRVSALQWDAIVSTVVGGGNV